MQIRSGNLFFFWGGLLFKDDLMVVSFQLISLHLGALERGHSGDQAAAETSFPCRSFTQNLRRDSWLQ